MNTRIQAVVALSAIGVSMWLCQGAKACGFEGAMSSGTALAAGSFVSVAQTSLDHMAPGMSNPLAGQAPIAGLYRFTVSAKGDQGIPDGTVLDQGFAAWHADGTEIMNSGRAPMTQSFCLGAWARTGPHTYRLNHWAMSWDATGKTYIGPTNIREYVRLNPDGSGYSGDFSLTQYRPDGKTPQGPTIHGVVLATRITADDH